MALLTQAEYAKRKGVTPQYVNKLVSQGKIVLVGRKVNPKQADAAIRAGHRPGVARRKGRRALIARKGKSKSTQPRAAVPHRSKPAKPLMSLKSDAQLSATKSLTAMRTENEKYKALTAKLDYERLCGQLLPKAQVLEAERRKNMNIRGRFRKLASSLAVVVARTTSPAEVQKLLLEEIDLVLDQLSKDPLETAASPEGPEFPTSQLDVVPAQVAQGMAASV